MKKKFTMMLIEDPAGRGRDPGACTLPDEPLERIYLFWFDLVPSELLGIPDQKARTSRHRLKVVVAANRLVAWNLHDEAGKEDLCKLVFWIGKTELEKRMAKADLQPEETVTVHTANHGKKRPYDPSALKQPLAGAVFELEVERTIGFK
jgi:hypothetical protein